MFFFWILNIYLIGVVVKLVKLVLWGISGYLALRLTVSYVYTYSVSMLIYDFRLQMICVGPIS